MQKLAQALRNLNAGKLLENESMSKHTTFRVGGPADLLFFPEGKEAVLAALKLAEEANVPSMVIGNGSNLIVGDQGIEFQPQLCGVIRLVVGVEYGIGDGFLPGIACGQDALCILRKHGLSAQQIRAFMSNLDHGEHSIQIDSYVIQFTTVGWQSKTIFPAIHDFRKNDGRRRF